MIDPEEQERRRIAELLEHGAKLWEIEQIRHNEFLAFIGLDEFAYELYLEHPELLEIIKRFQERYNDLRKDYLDSLDDAEYYRKQIDDMRPRYPHLSHVARFAFDPFSIQKGS